MPRLARALAEFCAGDGKVIDRALRKRLPHVRLNFASVGADAGDSLVTRLFEDPTDIVPRLRSIQARLKKIAGGVPATEILSALGDMAGRNLVSPELVARLAGSAGAATAGASERVLDPQRIVLTSVARSAIRDAFQVVLNQPDLAEDERKVAEQIYAEVSNVEDLLSLHFSRFSAGGALAERRTFLYLAWMLWAFFRIRSQSPKRADHSVYDALSGLEAQFVTFNYTDFFPVAIKARVKYFHGTIAHYLRADTREVVKDDADLSAAVDPTSVVAFLHKMRLDVTGGNELDLPAIVPPLTFKPVMSREQLRTWSEVDSAIERAPSVMVIGYSFAQADEHFNDLLRKGNPSARIIVTSRNATLAWERVCGVLGVSVATGKASQRDGRTFIKGGRVTCIGGPAEDFDRTTLHRLLMG